jgi:hypothetical protein
VKNRRAIIVYAILGMVLLAPFAPSVYKKIAARRAADAEQLTDEERLELQHLAARLSDRASACDYRWRQATSKDARATIVTSSEPCPVNLPPPTKDAAFRYQSSGYVDTFGIGGWSLAISRDGTIPPDEHCTSWKTVADLSRAGTVLNPADRFALLRARNKAIAPSEGLTVLFLVEHEATGKSMSGIPVPGFIDGKAFVYSEAEERVVCAGHVVADNTMDMTYSLDELRRDRELQLRWTLGEKVTSVPKR